VVPRASREEFACSEGDLVGAAAAMVLFHKIVQTKKGILPLLLLIMATLIESVDDMDEVSIPSFDVFLLNQNETASATQPKWQAAYIKKLLDDSIPSILKSRKAKKAFSDEGSREKNLFHLFLNCPLFEAMLQWTNVELRKRKQRNLNREAICLCWS
jgi:hypothetical protein